MKNQELKRLYQILLERFDELQSTYGICQRINEMYYLDIIISPDQRSLLKKHFSSERPRFKRKFFFFKIYTNKHFFKSELYIDKFYWWPLSPDGDAERKRFIQHLINKL